MSKYLLDTNILSEPLNKHPNKQVIHLLKQHKFNTALASPTLYELQQGARKLPHSHRQTVILNYIQGIRETLPILAYNEQAALYHGNETARLVKAGLTPSFIDAQIAAIAVCNGLILVTRNTKDFQFFTDLVVENWFDESMKK